MRKLSFFLIAAGLLSLASCTNDGGNEPYFGKPAEVTFNLKSLSTRALTGETEAGTTDENIVKMLEFFIFDSTGAVLDPKANADTTPGYVKLEKTAEETSLKLKHTLFVSAGANKKVIVVANMNLGYVEDATYDETIARISGNSFDRSGTTAANGAGARVTPADGFEMSGVGTFTVVEGSKNNVASVEIARLVSKIVAPTYTDFKGVTFNADDQDDINSIWGTNPDGTPRFVAGTTTFNFTPADATWVVINGIERSTVRFVGNETGNYTEPGDVAWEDWAYGSTETGPNYTTIGTVLKSTWNAKEYASVYSGQYGAAGSFFLDGNATQNAHRVYVFENKPAQKTTGAGTGHDPSTVTSFIIKGTLTPVGGGATLADIMTRYWRVNLTRDFDHHTLRGLVYYTNIDEILTTGYDNPKDAEDSEDILPPKGQDAVQFTVKIADWVVSETNMQM